MQRIVWLPVVLTLLLASALRTGADSRFVKPVLVIENDWYEESALLRGGFRFRAEHGNSWDNSDRHPFQLSDSPVEPYADGLSPELLPTGLDKSHDFVYRVRVRSYSGKVIKAVVWDYVFVDPETNAELARHNFYSEEKLSPGKTKLLVATSPRPPTRVISAKMLYRNASDPYIERVEIKAIIFVDGSLVALQPDKSSLLQSQD
jgi:hypothetical protein